MEHSCFLSFRGAFQYLTVQSNNTSSLHTRDSTEITKNTSPISLNFFYVSTPYQSPLTCSPSPVAITLPKSNKQWKTRAQRPESERG